MMGERIFKFKQFNVSHGRAAMKVGTDGVSLGAIAPVGYRVLDVGCGCGLIGLMMAQRGASEVVMIDIDREAADEAAGNAGLSPWADKITVLCRNFLDFDDEPFDSIVCNPPFFANGLLAPDPRRAAARHEDSLSPQAFMHKSAHLLSPTSRSTLPTISLILPPDRLSEWTFAAQLAALYPAEIIELTTKPTAPPKRVIAIFSRLNYAPHHRTISLQSEEYRQLTNPFYL